MEMLHIDIVSNILYRVPLKYISEIKFVCKQWHAIISDLHFSKLYHQTNNGVYNEILAMRLSPYASTIMSSLDFENKDTFDVYDAKFPGCPSHFVAVIGSCNGLVCLRINETLVFWNPCTKQYKISPKQPFAIHRHRSHSFGYDSVHDDYKVTWLNFGSQLKIYSLKSNTCHSSNLGIKLNEHYPGIYLNGSLHYVRHGCNDHIAFNLAEEKLGGTVPKPDGFHVKLGQFSVLDDCFCICRKNTMCDTIEIWVMKEYMVKGSWSKLCTISRDQLDWAYPINPLGTSQDGHILMIGLGDTKVIKYNMKKKTTCTTIPYDTHRKFIPHVLSWVSPNYNDGY